MVNGCGIIHTFGVLKHGIQESCRVNRGAAIIEPDEDSAIQPISIDDARGRMLFHFESLAIAAEAVCPPNNTRPVFKLGHYQKTDDIDLSSRVFGKMTRTQPIDESLDLELAVDGYMWPRLSEYRARETCIGSNEDTRPKFPASCGRAFRGGSFLNARDDSMR